MVFFKDVRFLIFALMLVACVDQVEQVVGKENAAGTVSILEIDVSGDFTSTSFGLTNQSENTYYSTIIVIAEYLNKGRKIGSERLVIYPVPLFGPDSTYVYEQPLNPVSNTDEVSFYVERASFYPENELKALLENRNR